MYIFFILWQIKENIKNSSKHQCKLWERSAMSQKTEAGYNDREYF